MEMKQRVCFSLRFVIQTDYPDLNSTETEKNEKINHMVAHSPYGDDRDRSALYTDHVYGEYDTHA